MLFILQIKDFAARSYINKHRAKGPKSKIKILTLQQNDQNTELAFWPCRLIPEKRFESNDEDIDATSQILMLDHRS